MRREKAVKIKEKAILLGFENCGIIKVSEMNDYADKLDERVKHVPENKRHLEHFYDFANLNKNYPWARSIVVCTSRYGKFHIPEHFQGMIGKSYLTDARKDVQADIYIACSELGKYLEELGLQQTTQRTFGITGLRWAAHKAGLGLIRKNNFLYTENGSWVRMDAWLIDEELTLIGNVKLKSCPDNCNKCIESCPTSSLMAPYIMDRTLCVSHITTWEGWDLSTDKNSRKLGNWVYGCDVCQDVCPSNHKKWIDEEEFPNLEKFGQLMSLEKIVAMDYETLENIIQPKFWYIKKENVWKWKMNALNAMLNNYKDEYSKYIDPALNDPNENVRKMAAWVKEKAVS
ncbi:MAG: epoxyqueuosine reductase [Syntrophomonadaceae bacterium]|jgi:epoxyqueuosine reductase|nr:epoxyqueuosine reductase [Syntrophomonadaceae bacterium]